MWERKKIELKSKTSEYINIMNNTALYKEDLTAEQKEDLIDKLETKKYEYKDRAATDTELQEVLNLLSTLKQTDVSIKVDQNLTCRVEMDADFRAKKTQLKLAEFNRIVDLTAPKGEREPDVTTGLWRAGKTASPSDRAYRKDVDAERLRKFQKKMLRKQMTPEMVTELNGRQKDILTKYDVHNKGLTGVGKYNPQTYNGLSLF